MKVKQLLRSTHYSRYNIKQSADRNLGHFKELLGCKQGRQENGPLLKAAVGSKKAIIVVVEAIIGVAVVVASIGVVVVVLRAMLHCTGSGHCQRKDLQEYHTNWKIFKISILTQPSLKGSLTNRS